MFDQADFVIGGITKRYRTVAGRPVAEHLYAQSIGAVQVDPEPRARSGRAFITLVQLLAAVAFVAIIITLTACDRPSDVEVTAAQVAAADEAKSNVRAEDRVAVLAEQLQPVHPLPYVAIVRDCLPSGRLCTPDRFYIPRSQR